VRLQGRHPLPRALKSASKLRPRRLQERRALVERDRVLQLAPMKLQLPQFKPQRLVQLLV
jgi:hypothetical protein